MDISPALPKDHHLIQSYGAGRFVVQGRDIKSNMLIWAAGSAPIEGEELGPINIESIVDPIPELILIGTGQSFKAISAELKDSLKSQGIKYEIMDTGAACRTYNILVSEDRRIAAMLTLI